MVDTSALKQNNNPAEAVPKSSRGWKWNNLLRRIWKDRSQYEGQGIGTTVVIPSDPDALLDRLDILLASKAAGNTGLEMRLLLCDELLRQKVLSRNHYKNLKLYI